MTESTSCVHPVHIVDSAKVIVDPVDLALDPFGQIVDRVCIIVYPVYVIVDPVDLIVDPIELTLDPADLNVDPVYLIVDPVDFIVHPVDLIDDPTRRFIYTMTGLTFSRQSSHYLIEEMYVLFEKFIHTNFYLVEPTNSRMLPRYILMFKSMVSPHLPHIPIINCAAKSVLLSVE